MSNWVGTIGRPKLPPKAAMLLLASIIVSFLAASSAPTPLYTVYQTRWGFSAIMTTVIFVTRDLTKYKPTTIRSTANHSAGWFMVTLVPSRW